MSKKNLEFHIEVGDYFGTLATVLDLWRQQEKVVWKEGDDTLLKKMIQDLVYLQNNYKIVKR